MRKSRFNCSNCGAKLGMRADDDLYFGGIKVPIKQSTPIQCDECGKFTRFVVNRQKPSSKESLTFTGESG